MLKRFLLQGKTLGSQGTDRLDRVPRGNEVRARVIESLEHCQSTEIMYEVPIVQSWAKTNRLLALKIRIGNDRPKAMR